MNRSEGVGQGKNAMRKGVSCLASFEDSLRTKCLDPFFRFYLLPTKQVRD